MADKDPEDDGPSLELPSFGFGRKRKERAEDPEPASRASDAEATSPATSDPDPEPAAVTTPDPEPEPRPEPIVPEVDPIDPAPPAEPDPQPLDRPTEVLPPVEPAGRRPRTVAAPTPVRAAGNAETRDATANGVRVDDPEVESGTRERRDLHFPGLPALPAVLVVGAVVGLTAVLLTWGSLRLCDVATGTASCGGGPGLLLLVAILIALTYLGGWLLRGFGISDAGSTSFLAVGLLAVVAMLFLVDSLDGWTGAVAVPVVTVVAYALSWRVTATLVDAGADQQ
jgi:hypothetical protein